MSRLEFSRSTRREALRRSGMLCEAVGILYGMVPDQRCRMPLGKGVEFHHELPAEFGGDNSLANCLAICILCHRFVTKIDIRNIRKSDRVRDKNSGAMPKSRSGLSSSRYRKTMSGTVIDKRTGEAVNNQRTTED